MKIETFEESSHRYRRILIGFVGVFLLLATHWFSVGESAKAWSDIGFACIALIGYGAILWVDRDG